MLLLGHRYLHLKDLTRLFETAKGASEKLLAVTHTTEVNLEKIYNTQVSEHYTQNLLDSNLAKHSNCLLQTQSKTILIRVAKFLPVYEVICQFARKQECPGGRPVIFDVDQHKEEHFWYINSVKNNFVFLNINR